MRECVKFLLKKGPEQNCLSLSLISPCKSLNLAIQPFQACLQFPKPGQELSHLPVEHVERLQRRLQALCPGSAAAGEAAVPAWVKRVTWWLYFCNSLITWFTSLIWARRTSLVLRTEAPASCLSSLPNLPLLSRLSECSMLQFQNIDLIDHLF